MMRYRLIELPSPVSRAPEDGKFGLLCEERSGEGWQARALLLELSCGRAQALRLARTCTLSGLTPDQALDAAARLLKEGPSAGEASQ